jgi:MFS family permease
VILIAIRTFLVGSVICARSTDLGVMLFGRFVQALGASAGGTISNAAVRDAFPPEIRTRVFLQVNTLFALAPGIGPIAGSLIDHYDLHAGRGLHRRRLHAGGGDLRLAEPPLLGFQSGRHRARHHAALAMSTTFTLLTVVALCLALLARLLLAGKL